MLYILVYHLNPETQWWGGSVQALGLRTSFTVALATAVGVLIRPPRLEHGARQFPLPYVLTIVFTLLALGSLVWGVGLTPRGEYQAEKFSKIVIILFILIRCVRKPAHYHAVMLAWLAGVFYLGYEACGGAGGQRAGRLTSGIGGPDFAESSGLAVHLVATLPLIGAMFFMCRTWWGRLLTLATGAVSVNTIIMTRTRNALAGLAALAVVTVLSLPPRYRLKGLAAVVAGTFLAVQLTDPHWWHRMESVLNYRQDRSAEQRVTLWKAALEMTRDYPFGIGLGNFHQTVMRYVPGLTIPRSAHSTPVACMAELGWPGLAVFTLVVGLSLWRLGRVRRAARQLTGHLDIQLYRWRTRFHLGWHATALRAALAGYLGCALFTTRLASEDLWLLIGLAACLHNVGKYALAQRQAEERNQPRPSTAVIASGSQPGESHDGRPSEPDPILEPRPAITPREPARI
jgi:hypothetical protein